MTDYKIIIDVFHKTKNIDVSIFIEREYLIYYQYNPYK